jgi:hypothetical protein
MEFRNGLMKHGDQQWQRGLRAIPFAMEWEMLCFLAAAQSTLIRTPYVVPLTSATGVPTQT